MKIILDSKSAQPLNEQIRAQIIRQIADGTLKADECLPSVRNAARMLGVGVITVKAAYDKLEADGFIYTQAGKGCFVGAQKGSCGAEALESLAAQSMRPCVERLKSLGIDLPAAAALLETPYKE